MANIIFGSWMARYPLGGNLSWALQYILGLKALGHNVYFVEKWGYDNSCYDPIKQISSNDCSYGIQIINELFKRFELQNNWCYVDKENNYYGISKKKIEEKFKTADLFIDSGSHGSWKEEADLSKQTALIDGEPGYTQMKWENNLKAGVPIPEYDHYFTNGKNIDRKNNTVPTLGIKWKHIYSPVNNSLFSYQKPAENAPFSTIMNWQSQKPISFKGKIYGQKDIEFQKFITLPLMVESKMEVSVSGEIPRQDLLKNNWIIESAQKVTLSFDSFINYLSYCKGEFSVCKNVFVVNQTGWFSDKSSAYLASGRPVILQNTGFDDHLPTGKGLFAVNSVEEAAEAIKVVEKDYQTHSKIARNIANEFLDAKIVMSEFLKQVGL